MIENQTQNLINRISISLKGPNVLKLIKIIFSFRVD
jgi:hypothetical protein